MDALLRARRRVTEACRSAATPRELLANLQAFLQRDVPADRWCAMTLDPATTLPTGGIHEHGVSDQYAARMLELEFSEDDVIPLTELARGRNAVQTLARATQGRNDTSARYREVLEPDGLGYEMRAVFRDGQGPWAALILFRERGGRDFAAAEIALVSGIAEQVTSALRRVLLLSEIEAQTSAEAPALLLVQADARLTVRHTSATAAYWLEQIEDGTAGELPYALFSLAQRARSSGHAVARLRTRTGRWMTAHAECMAGSEVSLILQPSRPYEIAQLLCAAYALTPRECEVARLVAAGCSNPEIAKLLFLSRYTVEDHLKRLYEKLGVNSRSGLVATLFFDQYVPRAQKGWALDGEGWFMCDGVSRSPASRAPQPPAIGRRRSAHPHDTR